MHKAWIFTQRKARTRTSALRCGKMDTRTSNTPGTHTSCSPLSPSALLPHLARGSLSKLTLSPLLHLPSPLLELFDIITSHPLSVLTPWMCSIELTPHRPNPPREKWGTREGDSGCAKWAIFAVTVDSRFSCSISPLPPPLSCKLLSPSSCTSLPQPQLALTAALSWMTLMLPTPPEARLNSVEEMADRSWNQNCQRCFLRTIGQPKINHLIFNS